VIETAVFGVDPGKTTGLCFLRVRSNRQVVKIAQVEVAVGDVSNVLGGWVHYCTDQDRDIIVGCERYTSGQQAAKHTAQPDADRVIGVVQDICRAVRVPCDLQQPADARMRFTSSSRK
jgi:hypothetical protein